MTSIKRYDRHFSMVLDAKNITRWQGLLMFIGTTSVYLMLFVDAIHSQDDIYIYIYIHMMIYLLRMVMFHSYYMLLLWSSTWGLHIPGTSFLVGSMRFSMPIPGLILRGYPQKIWPEKWNKYGTSILGSWNSHWYLEEYCDSCVFYLAFWSSFYRNLGGWCNSMAWF